jgi:hypothetical protein
MTYEEIIEAIIWRSIESGGRAFTAREMGEHLGVTPGRVRNACAKEWAVHSWTRVSSEDVMVPTYESSYGTRKGSAKAVGYSVTRREVCRRCINALQEVKS